MYRNMLKCMTALYMLISNVYVPLGTPGKVSLNSCRSSMRLCV